MSESVIYCSGFYGLDECNGEVVSVEVNKDLQTDEIDYDGWHRFCCSKHASSFNPRTTFVSLDTYLKNIQET